MTEKKRGFTPEQVKEFEEFEARLAGVTFVKKCEYPDDYTPDVLSKKQTEELERKQQPEKEK